MHYWYVNKHLMRSVYLGLSDIEDPACDYLFLRADYLEFVRLQSSTPQCFKSPTQSMQQNWHNLQSWSLPPLHLFPLLSSPSSFSHSFNSSLFCLFIIGSLPLLSYVVYLSLAWSSLCFCFPSLSSVFLLLTPSAYSYWLLCPHSLIAFLSFWSSFFLIRAHVCKYIVCSDYLHWLINVQLCSKWSKDSDFYGKLEMPVLLPLCSLFLAVSFLTRHSLMFTSVF